MVDVDVVILEELGRLAPLGGNDDTDWPDVLRRSRAGQRHVTRPSRRFTLALLAAALIATAIAVSPLGAAIGREVGNFSDWLTGHPGTPASSSAQRAFARESRSWFGFPRHTTLRRLIVIPSAGLTVTVFGFRSADALCLRLVVSAPAHASDLACAPLSELRTRRQPALVMTSDYSIGKGRKALDGPLPVWMPQAEVTFGVLADNVKHVLIGRSDGSIREATVRGDAFLSITAHPAPELRVTHVWAVLKGKRVAIPFVPAFTPLALLSGRPPAAYTKPAGPSTVDRPLHTGAIAWFARRQLRGQPVPAQLRRGGLLATSGNVIFARMVAPDTRSLERVIISLRPAGRRFFGGRLRNNNELCAEVVGGVFNAGHAGSGGCWPAGRLFSTGPFTESLSEGPNNQYVTISGVASDDVARLRLYLANGTYTPIALANNAYVAEASAAEYPLRIVGYDVSGRIIGIRTLMGNQFVAPKDAPKRGVAWHTVLRNKAGAVMTAPSTEGHLCVAFRSSNAGATIGCAKPVVADEMRISLIGANKRVTIYGLTGSAIIHVVLRFADRKSRELTPMHGYLLAQLTSEQFGSVLSATGVDGEGKTLALQRFRR